MQCSDEIWATIPGLPNYYQVSTTGEIRSCDHVGEYVTKSGRHVTRRFAGKQLTADSSGNVYIQNQNYKLSELVVSTFIRSLSKFEYVDFIDGDQTNTQLSNLVIVDTSTFGSNWAPVPGYDGIYQVSHEGVVRRVRTKVPHPRVGSLTLLPMIMSTSLDEDGYVRLSLTHPNFGSTGYGVHQLVARTFIPNPDGLPCVNHIDGNKLNNHVSNLEWCTIEYNNHHAERIGLRPKSIYRAVGESAKRRLSKAVRCINTGEIFCSMIEAERHFHLRSAAVHDSITDCRPTTSGLSFELVNQ